MSDTRLFTVLGDPVSKGRPRVYHGHGVTPKKTQNAEKLVRDTYLSNYPSAPPYEGDVNIIIDCYMAGKRGKDWDNLAKLVCDALNGVAYVDDRQIMVALVRKHVPDDFVQGVRGLRRRVAGDALLYKGIPRDACTVVELFEV